MIALLKKDWRQNRTLVIGSLILAAMPYVIILVGNWCAPGRRPAARELNENLMEASNMAMWIMVLLSAAFGGAAFAQERRERSADFLAMLPATRLQILISKFAIAIGWLALVWLFNFGALLLNGWLHPDAGKLLSSDFLTSAALSVTCALMIFGIASLCSTFLNSPAIAASIGIGSIAALWITMFLIFNSRNMARGGNDDVIFDVIVALTACIGLASLIGGTIYYVRRIEP